MFEKRWMVCLALAALFCSPVMGQEGPKKGGSVPIMFVPPPIENATYSLGVYETKTGKLVRRLCEAAGQNTFKIGLNGLLTSWDGKDDDGKPLPPGKYSARGYAVGPLKVEGEAILGNDWIDDDESPRVQEAVTIVGIPEDEGLAVVFRLGAANWVIARYKGKDGSLVWQKPITPAFVMPKSLGVPFCSLEIVGNTLVLNNYPNKRTEYRLTDGECRPLPEVTFVRPNYQSSLGKNESVWMIENDVLSERSMSGDALRSLAPKEGEPLPVAVSAFTKNERLYLLEKKAGWQRVRGLSWVDTKEQNGKPVSTWQTFFERNIRLLDPLTGSEDIVSAKVAPPPVEIALEENSLQPGRHERLNLTATVDEKGSYLSTPDGLRLRQISQRAGLRAAKLAEDKTGGLKYFQSDGAAWDQFSIKGVKKIVGFDAGEFEIDAAGEKPVAEKAPEPDL